MAVKTRNDVGNKSTSSSYEEINYDEKIAENERQTQADLSEVESLYDNAMDGMDVHINDQINATKEWEEKQTELQEEKTDFAIEQINQQKDQTYKDYVKEQSGAYVDWQKQSNAYGVNAEQMASSGMTNTGFSESSMVSMYNTYQNRVVAAREAYTRAVLNYDNAIKEAQLQNNSILAEIAYESLQKQLELSLQGFQYKNTLILQKAAEKRTIKNESYSRWLSLLDKLNTEKALAEEKRQFDENLKFQREQFNWQKSQAGGSTITKSGGGSGSSSKGSSSNSSSSNGSNIAKDTSNDSNNKAKEDALKAVNRGAMTSYPLAKDLLVACGADNLSPRLLNASEWTKAKKTGELGSEFEGVNSYREYLKYYCTWAINNS